MQKISKQHKKDMQDRFNKLKQENILGIDDSGRGPVLGPMIMAGVMIPSYIGGQFKDLGIKDSKKLTPQKREDFAHVIKDNSSFSVIKIWPDEIMLRNHDGVNINKLEAIKAAQIINEMLPDVAIVDCPSNNIKKWQAELEKHLLEGVRKEVKLVIEHKADSKYVECSAASIIANVERDEEIA